MNWLTVNLNIIRVYNSCNRDEFKKLIDYIVSTGKIQKYLTQKRYIWNWIRPRDFYKMMSYYIIDKFSYVGKDSTEDDFKICKDLIHTILTTTEDQTICKSFVWSIMKKVPLVSIDTIPYTSADKIRSIIYDRSGVYCDAAMTPLINIIIDLKDQIKMYQSLAEMDID